MKKNFKSSAKQLTRRTYAALTLPGTILALACLVSNTSMAAQSSGSTDCSVALVGKHYSSTTDPCDASTAKAFAGGTQFQQGQGAAGSKLVISPDYNLKQAVEVFRKDAGGGNAAAQVNLGVLYVNGWGVAQNYATALYWFNRAAEQKHGRAFYNLGALYMNGSGVRQDYAQAAKYFRLGAEAGDTGALTNLGYLYDRGLGVEADARIAAGLYERAAKQGDPVAQNNLAEMLAQGIGRPADLEAAFRLYQQAAQQGHSGAQIQLAYMYALGKGTAKDLETALMWVAAATLAGDSRGRELSKMLNAQLTAEQVARASERARQLGVKPATLDARLH